MRDFAWASSRKFAWDAQGHNQPGAQNETVMAMSFYPKEGGELWQKYSTAAVVHTMEVYSRFSFDYPYPTAQSVNGPVGGMEYPMITFNGPRTNLHSQAHHELQAALRRGRRDLPKGHSWYPFHSEAKRPADLCPSPQAPTRQLLKMLGRDQGVW